LNNADNITTQQLNGKKIDKYATQQLRRYHFAAHIFFHFEEAMRVTPSLPHWGGNPRGASP
jgi:hypothetical protein